MRSWVHFTAKPVLRMPPGYRVLRKLSSITDSGVMLLRLGGWVAATNSWLMPGNDRPIMPTLAAQGCAATVSITSYPSRPWSVSQ